MRCLRCTRCHRGAGDRVFLDSTVSHSVFVVLAGVLGITNSFPMPLLNAILSNNSSELEQGEILGINASYLSISNALGPAVAGLLVSISYSTPFWVSGILTLATAAFALRLKSIVDCRYKSV